MGAGANRTLKALFSKSSVLEENSPMHRAEETFPKMSQYMQSPPKLGG